MPVTRPHARPDLGIGEIDNEAVVYDPRVHELHYLNTSAALVFDLCDGTATMREMAEAIADVAGAPAAEIEPQVRRIVREFRSHEILRPTRPGADEQSEDSPDTRERIRVEVPHST